MGWSPFRWAFTIVSTVSGSLVGFYLQDKYGEQYKLDRTRRINAILDAEEQREAALKGEKWIPLYPPVAAPTNNDVVSVLKRALDDDK
jgi:hypothetical protein